MTAKINTMTYPKISTHFFMSGGIRVVIKSTEIDVPCRMAAGRLRKHRAGSMYSHISSTPRIAFPVGRPMTLYMRDINMNKITIAITLIKKSVIFSMTCILDTSLADGLPHPRSPVLPRSVSPLFSSSRNPGLFQYVHAGTLSLPCIGLFE